MSVLLSLQKKILKEMLGKSFGSLITSLFGEGKTLKEIKEARLDIHALIKLVTKLMASAEELVTLAEETRALSASTNESVGVASAKVDEAIAKISELKDLVASGTVVTPEQLDEAVKDLTEAKGSLQSAQASSTEIGTKIDAAIEEGEEG